MMIRICSCLAFIFLLTVASIGPLRADSVLGSNLADAMRAGGYVILMRHASSPRDPPDAATANVDNPNLERQLDEAGRSSAVAFGEALRQLHLALGPVFCSPAYRAIETLRFAKLGPITEIPQLGDGGHSMVSDQSGARAAWLRAKTAEPTKPGNNTLIVTHFPNIAEAYPQDSKSLADGEALILHPDGRGSAVFVARVKIDEWSHLGGGH
jgi:phosphohistidine phosphatase SixA